MRGIQYHTYGGPELMRLEEVEPAAPGKVRVRAVAAMPVRLPAQPTGAAPSAQLPDSRYRHLGRARQGDRSTPGISIEALMLDGGVW